VKSNSKSLVWLEKMDKKALDRSLKERQAKEAEQVKPKKAEESDDEDNDEEEEEEADYERAPRLVGKSETDKSDRSRGLPVKTLDGQVIFQPKQQQRAQLRVQQLEEEEEGDDEQEHLEGKGGSMKKPPSTKNASAPSNVVTLMVPGVTIQDDLVDEGKREEDRRREEEEAQVVRQKEKQKAQQERAREAREEADGGLPAPLAATLRSIKDQQKRTQAAKEAIAVSAQKLLSGPEDHVAELKTLLALASPSRQEGRDPQVPRLSLLSLLAVFRDIVPGYRIRLPTEEELKVKVSKDVQKVRDFEAALLRSYQSYLKLLLAAMGTGARSGAGAGAGAQRPPTSRRPEDGGEGPRDEDHGMCGH
jgi:nucleolar complex protein 3